MYILFTHVLSKSNSFLLQINSWTCHIIMLFIVAENYIFKCKQKESKPTVIGLEFFIRNYYNSERILAIKMILWHNLNIFGDLYHLYSLVFETQYICIYVSNWKFNLFILCKKNHQMYIVYDLISFVFFLNKRFKKKMNMPYSQMITEILNWCTSINLT